VKAKIRCCVSCAWVYRESEKIPCCPACGFGASYAARYVYGKKAYGYLNSQKPWFERKMSDFESKLFYRMYIIKKLVEEGNGREEGKM
jgi:hypothetical protein